MQLNNVDPSPAYSCPTAIDVAARVAAERRRLGLSQERAASILGISRNTYRQYEAGKFYPTLPTLFALLEALGMDPRALLPEWFGAVDRVSL